MRWMLVVLGSISVARPIAAQDDSLLTAAVQLATEGQGDSARALVQRRLAALSPSDSLYPQVLYVSGVVAGDAGTAMTSFRRVSIEFPGSAWADRALLRLSQLSYASGDMAAALRAAERVLSDYPLSTVRAEAAFWSGRAQLELGNAAEGCRLLTDARQGAVDDIELANRVQYHLQRCEAVLAGTDPSRAQPQPPARPAQRVIYSVQVAAVGTAVAADDLMRALRADGYDPHVVRAEDGLFRVRVGRFPVRDEAQRIANDLKRRRGGSPFVVEEP
ncbi:MAG: SPOR domain-containing protein [Gemmatimonadota bacterium]|nr:SPOR domain-containing protein [Gemmatimonadota bacterium]MDH3366218.1 SPOR domain-containing protein [Gemmatimonadota bacterium]MDH3476975.1 SPOR domain-containing protein [Gemmatimonadota bacterium]MDH3568977.1 SPOR domain-containing protein [Gemmatimonadota bacterium]MDH5548737.1 SPOR domain-containing protein [Gemmatimonadota bacterium]